MTSAQPASPEVKALEVDPQYPLAANDLAHLMLEHGGSVDVALSLV